MMSHPRCVVNNIVLIITSVVEQNSFIKSDLLKNISANIIRRHQILCRSYLIDILHV
jgi:hypothetical protein